MTDSAAGLFVSLEGTRGSGKSTQAQDLKELLEAKGFTVTLTREPAGCPLGRRVRELLSDFSLKLNPRSELFLFEAARAQHVAEVIRPALQRGDIVICDRFSDSTLAYQGYGRGLRLDDVRLANSIATRGLVPDLTVFLNVPVETGLGRKAGENAPDSIGQEQAPFHERVRQGYLTMAAQEPNRFLVRDGMLAPEEITRTIWRWLEPLLT